MLHRLGRQQHQPRHPLLLPLRSVVHRSEVLLRRLLHLLLLRHSVLHHLVRQQPPHLRPRLHLVLHHLVRQQRQPLHPLLLLRLHSVLHRSELPLRRPLHLLLLHLRQLRSVVALVGQVAEASVISVAHRGGDQPRLVPQRRRSTSRRLVLASRRE